MSQISNLKFILSHPLTKDQKISTFFRLLKWQINGFLNPYSVVYPFIGNTKLIIAKGQTGATGNIYVGLHEFEEMSFILHLLTENDLFVDIGANIGSYTILASGYKNAQSISIEPDPNTYQQLSTNVAINRLFEKVNTCNFGLGATNHRVRFTVGLDTTNHVLAENEKMNAYNEVEIKKLDDILENKNPLLLKIDVEGFETEVLQGAHCTLNDNNLKAIIIELNGMGKRYGFDESLIHQLLLHHQFLPYTYEPFTRRLRKLETYGNENTIYLRDLDFIKKRIKESSNFDIFGKSI